MRRLLRLDFARSAGASARALIAVGLILVSPVVAQTIDPAILGRIQGQLGAPPSPSQQLDRSRSQDEELADPGLSSPTGSTAEELELRRQRSRALLDEIYTPSAVELEYRQRLGDPNLRQFGYDLFRSTQASSGPLTGEVGGNYILGVGDELVVSFQGATSASHSR